LSVLLHASSHLSGLLVTWKFYAEGGGQTQIQVACKHGPLKHGPLNHGDNKERYDDNKGRNKGRHEEIKRGKIRRGWGDEGGGGGAKIKGWLACWNGGEWRQEQGEVTKGGP
jgi:hypothetical protein